MSTGSRVLELVLSAYIHHIPTQVELCSLLDAQKTTFLEVKLEYVSFGESVDVCVGCIVNITGSSDVPTTKAT